MSTQKRTTNKGKRLCRDRTVLKIKVTEFLSLFLRTRNSSVPFLSYTAVYLSRRGTGPLQTPCFSCGQNDVALLLLRPHTDTPCRDGESQRTLYGTTSFMSFEIPNPPHFDNEGLRVSPRSYPSCKGFRVTTVLIPCTCPERQLLLLEVYKTPRDGNLINLGYEQ